TTPGQTMLEKAISRGLAPGSIIAGRIVPAGGRAWLPWRGNHHVPTGRWIAVAPVRPGRGRRRDRLATLGHDAQVTHRTYPRTAGAPLRGGRARAGEARRVRSGPGDEVSPGRLQDRAADQRDRRDDEAAGTAEEALRGPGRRGRIAEVH